MLRKGHRVGGKSQHHPQISPSFVQAMNALQPAKDQHPIPHSGW
ncbi:MULTISPECIES: hypothetical protein [Hydrotalea]|nr:MULTISPECIES: hypothetical protein [Hydrotalea]